MPGPLPLISKNGWARAVEDCEHVQGPVDAHQSEVQDRCVVQKSRLMKRIPAVIADQQMAFLYDVNLDR